MKLLDQSRIGSLEIKNRMAFPPITTGFGAENGCFGQEEIDFAVERARGGAALIFTDGVATDRHHQLTVASPLPYFDSDEQISKFCRYADAIRHNGAKTCIQLYHAGRQTSLAKRSGKAPIGPSAVSTSLLEKIPYPDSVEMSEAEIENAINGFVLSASRAKNAGFDAVDIDGGAGYLIQQFMSPLTNKRRDQWGGSLENRMRFPIEIVNRIRNVVGIDYPLIFDLCMNEYTDGGITPDQGADMAQMLEEAGINAFRIHGVTLETYHHMFPTMEVPRGVNKPMGRLLKDSLKTAKVMLGQRINNPDLAEQILQEEAADIILLGRPLICDPYFPDKVKKGKKESIRKCVACCQCVDNLGFARPIRCALNPVVGFERDYAKLPRADSSRKILVIGGGPAGMETARISAQKGHEVILAEKSSHLGGQVKYGSLPPHKEELRNIIEYYEYQLKELRVDIRLNCNIDRQQVIDIRPDKIILAAGAVPISPPIPGGEDSCVVKAQEVLEDIDSINGDSIVVIGGGSVGAEIAEMCAVRGNNVTILEMKDAIAEDMGLFLALGFHDRLDKLSINRITQATVKKIEKKSVLYTDKNGEDHFIKADTVVLATGYTADRTLLDDLEELANEVIMVGDCVSPRKIFDAVHEGFHAARIIE